MKRFSLLMIVLAGCGKPSVPGNASVVPIAAAEQAVAKDDASKKDAPATSQFRFSSDEAGQRFEKLLPPVPLARLEPLPLKVPSERGLPASITQPTLSTSEAFQGTVRYPSATTIVVRPMALPDRVPIDLARIQIDRPEVLNFPVGGLTKRETPDVKLPTALPILAKPIPDRASLDDPTTEFTAESIINKNLPLRSTTAPFVKVNLPDPFENAPAAKVKVTIPDDPAKALGTVPPPK